VGWAFYAAGHEIRVQQSADRSAIRLHYPGEEGETAAAANKPYRITRDDGRVIEGKSDANGLTDVVKDEAMRILKIDILKPTT
jgi:type VI secretion system secreted protein VgrG